jgi:signal transduction histidine kinase
VDARDESIDTVRRGAGGGGDRRLGLVFFALLGLLAVNSLVAIRSMLALEDSERSVIHTQMVLTALQTVEATLVDAETGQRGYILTGDASYLTPYLVARQTLNSDIAELEQLTADAPLEQSRLAEIKPLLANRLALLDETIQLRESGHTQEAIQHVQTGQGERDMDAIRALLGQMDANEGSLLAQQNADAQASLTQAIISVVVTGLADAILLTLVALLIRQRMIRREQVARERARLLGDEQTARQAAEAAVRVRDQFLSIASHELNTPLTALKALSEYVTRRLHARPEGPVETAEAEEAATLLRLSVGRLERLVSDLLDVSRIESGQLSLSTERADLADLCRQAVAEQRAVGQIVHMDLPQTPVNVTVDGERTMQVLTNLLGNARKYSPLDRPALLSLWCEGGEAVCRIRDNGVGIPPAELAHIFERYYRAPSVAVQTGSQMGLGLGLHVCREIVERQGGRIWAESVPGEGSRFYVALPLVVGDSDSLIREPLSVVREGDEHGARASRG